MAKAARNIPKAEWCPNCGGVIIKTGGMILDAKILGLKRSEERAEPVYTPRGERLYGMRAVTGWEWSEDLTEPEAYGHRRHRCSWRRRRETEND